MLHVCVCVCLHLFIYFVYLVTLRFLIFTIIPGTQFNVFSLNLNLVIQYTVNIQNCIYPLSSNCMLRSFDKVSFSSTPRSC